MKKRTGRIPTYVMVIDAILCIIFGFYALTSKVKVFAPYYKQKLEASTLALEYFKEVKNLRTTLGIPIDYVNDPAGSGLIGVQLSPITTEYGDLTAKLTSINPNFAALFVSYFKRLNLKEGDMVAVHFTGSFPALNISLLAALKTLKLKPIIISSVGSSMWGANIPGFTYLDMENFLFNKNLVNSKTSYASLGGVDDVGRGLTEEGREIIFKTIEKNNVKLIKANSLKESIEMKLKLYNDEAGDNPIKCFVNIGGNASVIAGVEVPSGFVDFKYQNHPGLIGAFLSRNIPVINIQNVNYLATRYNLPLSPSYIQQPGIGKLFYEIRYSKTAAGISLAILLIIITFSLIVDVDYYIQRILRRV